MLSDNSQIKAVRPNECTMLIGLPFNRASFLASQCCGDLSYAATYLGGWDQYAINAIPCLKILEKVSKRAGINLIMGGGVKDLKATFNSKRDEIVIIISHWTGDGVELNGEVLSSEDVLSAIPEDYSGILDLCVCHPTSLVRKIEYYRPFCITRSIPIAANPVIWTMYYTALFKLLEGGGYSYLKASEIISIGLLEY